MKNSSIGDVSLTLAQGQDQIEHCQSLIITYTRLSGLDRQYQISTANRCSAHETAPISAECQAP